MAGAASAPGAGSTFFSRVRLAGDGSLAVTGFQAQGSGYTPLETVLFAASSDGAVGGEPVGRVIANAPVQGVWMDDGSWLALSWPMGELPGRRARRRAMRRPTGETAPRRSATR